MVNRDRSPSEAADQPPSIESNPQHLSVAETTDVLFDQLEYLIAHVGGNCPPECADCARLEQVRILLLLPFRTLGYHT